MSGPGDRASKTSSQRAPMPSSNAKGHDWAPIRADVEFRCTPGSKSSARSQMSPARKPGDLTETLALIAGAGQSREGQQP